MDIEKAITENTHLQKEVLKRIREANQEYRESPFDKVLLFKLSMLMHQFDLYNEIIKELNLMLMNQKDVSP